MSKATNFAVFSNAEQTNSASDDRLKVEREGALAYYFGI